MAKAAFVSAGLLAVASLAALPAGANVIPWKGPGWYVQSRQYVPEFLFGGPFQTRAECRAKIIKLDEERSEGVKFYCTYHRPDSDRVITPWNGPGWYLVDLVWQRVLPGRFATRELCDEKIAALTKRDPEFAAYCGRRDDR